MIDAELLLLVTADLIRDESEVLHVYPDSLGYLTLGIGRLVDKRRGGGITREESRYLFGHDLDKVVAELNRVAPWWVAAPQKVKRTLINMCFALGETGLSEFHHTLEALRTADYAAAAAHLLNSLWAHQVGARARRLADLVEAPNG